MIWVNLSSERKCEGLIWMKIKNLDISDIFEKTLRDYLHLYPIYINFKLRVESKFKVNEDKNSSM